MNMFLLESFFIIVLVFWIDKIYQIDIIFKILNMKKSDLAASKRLQTNFQLQPTLKNALLYAAKKVLPTKECSSLKISIQ